MSDLTLPCVACKPVPHMAVDHHFGGHNDVRGDKGRGPCSFNNPQIDQLVEGDEPRERCHCPGFKAADAD